MTIKVTQEDRALVHKWWSPEDGLTSRQMMLEDFSRHRQAAYERGVLDGAMQAVREMRK